MTRYEPNDRTQIVFSAVGLALLLFALPLAVAATHGHGPGPFIVAMVSGTWCAIMLRRWMRRTEYAASIDYYTRQGVRVRTFGHFLPQASVEAEIDKAIGFGSQFAVQETIERFFDGATLTVEGDLVEDSRGRKDRGLTEGNHMYVADRPQDSVTDVLDRVHHEAGHVALNAAKFYADEEMQHHEMKARGYGL